MTGKQSIRKRRSQTPVRRPGHRRTPLRRTGTGWRGRTIVAAAALIVGLLAWATLARQFAPASNTNLARFDAIIVLGTPADSDGNPTPRQLARVTEGVREYERGVAPRLIFTGGAAYNVTVEARVMAKVAEAQGVPEAGILVEPEAKDTIQNACYAVRLMKAHGWRSAEVVSSASHLPRAAIIFNRLPVEWRVHAAPPLEPESAAASTWATALEVLKTLRYLAYADWAERCEP